MAWTEPNTIAPDMRTRLRRLFPAFSWEIVHIDHLAETVEMRGLFHLNGRRCGIYLTWNHEQFDDSPDIVDDRVKYQVAQAMIQIIIKG